MKGNHQYTKLKKVLSEKEYKQRILVIRLSALGDVAILQPVVVARAKANPDTLFTIAAPGILRPLFEGIENVEFVATKKQQSVIRLYKALSSFKPDIVADMHHVNRVIGACWLFRLNGIRVESIKKERCKRRRLLRKRNKKLIYLKPSWQRYNEVFDACGLERGILDTTAIEPQKHSGVKKIGIAPFAQHRGKILPEKNMRELIDILSTNSNNHIVLFGSKQEASILEKWSEGYDNVESTAGKHDFEKELEIIKSLDVMVSMDSANMHFASCYGVPVVSLWGATHRACGFYGWRQNEKWCVEKEMSCRPCSMFGNKPCQHGNYKCLSEITANEVYDKIKAILYD